MVSFADILPPAKGILPYYMLLLSLLAIGNSAQNYITLHYSRRLYNGQYVRNKTLPARSDKYNPEDSVKKFVPAPAGTKEETIDQGTPLAARCFGTWTLLTSIVRLYCAYHLHHAHMYDLAIWTYVVAFGHFASELFVFKSMTFGVPQAFPFSLAGIALIWMPSVRSFYVDSP
ncbi:Ergosterol biosynthetic protein 28 [Colletotrichum sidae]|uniref:Ergosterol biosynthetic protein 28 n=4 Tax=Colletotrichum orbiculare species complex TaxID=2707354 RepID=N4VW96_COLOR|nr:Ergosterol biosynthetic protein 28 [Colletotrichum orbiculare MAFF 240422]TDZ30924.1 Ergosterol biosynthetic protein 28 [Colletotrichum spinosum]TDZ35640.1 Ergosterol biosynthetic protein 28 [Colletotrichum trifolii]TEA18292.1 Ergosterol biosynthetic protein 28 [Colletotrichum sidae]